MEAQAVVSAAQAISPLKVKGRVGIGGAPGFGRKRLCGGLDRDDFAVVSFEAIELIGAAFGLERPRVGVGLCGRGLALEPFDLAGFEAERVGQEPHHRDQGDDADDGDEGRPEKAGGEGQRSRAH